VRCREIFTIAEDDPRMEYRSAAWQSPHDQYPRTAFRFDDNRAQAGVLPEVRSQPINTALPDEESVQTHHNINCPRCGADNRNWLFVRENVHPLRANNVLIGGIILVGLSAFAIWYLLATVAVESSISSLDVALAIICIFFAGSLPLLIVPKQWKEVRDFQLAHRFLTKFPRPKTPTVLFNVVILYIIFILAIPGLKYGLIPIACYTVPICDQSEEIGEGTQYSAESELKFWGKLLVVGSLVSFVSSVFAILAVNEVVATVRRHLPNPIFANTASMVRVVLWEAKRALEINEHFQEIQWSLARRNNVGGLDMVGYYRDPPEILSNGRLDEQVRRQVYTIKTDCWCNIISTRIDDDKGPRPAGGKYYAVPIPRGEPIPIMTIGRERY
jgi:hypothetical protein